MYASTIPKEAYVGAEEINEPLISALAISVMYTIAGLVPQAANNLYYTLVENVVYFMKCT